MPRGTGIPTDEAIPLVAEACAYYDEADVIRWFERNKRMTGHYPAVYQSTIEDIRTFRKVPNEPFRKPWAELSRPMILGMPLNVTGAHEGITTDTEPEWCQRFRDELARVIALPEGLDSPPGKIGPGDLSAGRLSGYFRECLGFKAHRHQSGLISLSWLIQYEVAEALCKTLGLTPMAVGI